MEVSINDCPIHDVVVYSDRAEVKRVVSVEVPDGESTIVVKDLSQSADKDSIRVESQGEAIILDVVYFTEEKKASEEKIDDTCSSLLDQIKEKEDELKHLSFYTSCLEKQKMKLKQFAQNVAKGQTSNKNTDIQESAFSNLVLPNNVHLMISFMRRCESYLSMLDEKLLENSRHNQIIEDEKKVLECQAKQVNVAADSENNTNTIRCIKMIVEAKEKHLLNLVVSYLVCNASWTPVYDVRVFTKEKALKIHYHGLIKQATGESWDNAAISLSTAKPNIGGSAPQLGIHHVGFKHQAPLTIMRRNYSDISIDDIPQSCGVTEEVLLLSSPMGFQKSSKIVKERSMFSRHRKRASISSSIPSLDIEVAKVDIGQLFNMTYSIARKATIPADNTEHKVTVAIIDLQPEFVYVSVPRLSPHCFLQSSVKNSSLYAILAGPANIFLDNNFLAKSSLPDTSPNEEFTISLGADQSMHVTCHPLKLLRGTSGRLTKQNLLTYTYKFSVKNSQINNIKLKLSEQVPLSTDNKLKVVLQTPDIKKHNVQVPFPYGHCILNEENNIEWHCVIPSSSSIDIQLVYTVEFPLSTVVEGLPSL